MPPGRKMRALVGNFASFSAVAANDIASYLVTTKPRSASSIAGSNTSPRLPVPNRSSASHQPFTLPGTIGER